MYQSNQLTNKSQLVRNSINRSAWRSGLHLSALALVVAWLVLSPQARAVCQQGCDVTHANTFLCDDALIANTTGTDNTATGFQALFSNMTGSFNTANGAVALYSNTTGSINTATGASGLLYNTTGGGNTANGSNALLSNTMGSNNTAIGSNALSKNTTASSNTATGHLALVNNNAGYRNTATGESALLNNIGGHGNTAIGFHALYENDGSNNIGLGFNAGNNLTNGSGNVCIGYNVVGVAGENNTTRISNIYSSVASGRAVYINSDKKIGTLVSSRRFKEEIKPMDKASEAILKLKPVSFRYKKEIEPGGAIMFGLIAEEVEKVDPDLVTRNEKGEPEAVRYEAVNAMLLNEFLKEYRKVEKQEMTISQLRSTVAQQQKDFQATVEQLTRRLDEQASQIQKVSAQVEMGRDMRQMISSNQ
jgi:Chaperone of endosialidase